MRTEDEDLQVSDADQSSIPLAEASEDVVDKVHAGTMRQSPIPLVEASDEDVVAKVHVGTRRPQLEEVVQEHRLRGGEGEREADEHDTVTGASGYSTVPRPDVLAHACEGVMECGVHRPAADILVIQTTSVPEGRSGRKCWRRRSELCTTATQPSSVG